MVMQEDLDLVALEVILEIVEGQEQVGLEATTETQEDQVQEEMVADLDLGATLEIQEDRALVETLDHQAMVDLVVETV